MTRSARGDNVSAPVAWLLFDLGSGVDDDTVAVSVTSAPPAADTVTLIVVRPSAGSVSRSHVTVLVVVGTAALGVVVHVPLAAGVTVTEVTVNGELDEMLSTTSTFWASDG